MKFDLQKFYKFCSELKIETKEEGLKKMGKLLGTQTYVMEEIQKGLDQDVHFFVILKGRQLGITTVFAGPGPILAVHPSGLARNSGRRH
jgi:hypothetical protein